MDEGISYSMKPIYNIIKGNLASYLNSPLCSGAIDNISLRITEAIEIFVKEEQGKVDKK